MERYKIVIEYDGNGYYGWQEQEDLPTIQGVIQDAIFQFCGEKVILTGAGRTDAGVHALAQVAHFQILRETNANEVMGAINHFLQHTKIAIISCELVDNNFHARFSAKSRSYIYTIINRKTHLTHNKGYAWQVIDELDADLMHTGGQYLLGSHNLESFRAANCQAHSARRSIDKLQVIRHGNRVDVTITAKSFLHNQVRIIVGTLRKIGNGSWPPSKIAEIISARSRQAAGPTAPSSGLYLSGVEY
jgi:tRNA pseudouridine38-40 synthase